jgi:hypothetical protein
MDEHANLHSFFWNKIKNKKVVVKSVAVLGIKINNNRLNNPNK